MTRPAQRNPLFGARQEEGPHVATCTSPFARLPFGLRELP